MKTHSSKSYAKFVFAMKALTFLLFAIYPQSVVAQTNTFPQSGNVGIGTTSPPNPLTITRNGSTPYTSRPAYELLQLIDRTDNTPQILFGSAHNGMFLRYTSTDYAGVNQRLSIFTGGLVEAFAVNNDGNVGIGTTSPAAKLHVWGSGNVSSIFESATAASELGIVSSSAGSGSWSIGTGWASSGATRNLYFYDNVAAATRFLINSSGHVGIGTSSPFYSLDVQGGAINSSGGLCMAGDCKTAWSQVGGQWTTSGSNVHYSTGKVGVGISSPLYSLDVNGGLNGFRARAATTSANDAIATFENASGIQAILRGNGALGIGTTNPIGKIDVRQNSGTLATLLTSYGANEDAYLRGGSSGAVVHIGDVPATTSKVLLMENGGNVGIGTSSPTTNLHVVGSGYVSGDFTVQGIIHAKYQDVAEWVPSTHALLAGTVVTLDPSKSNHVEASTKAYDTRVAGVVSGQPGIALGEQGDGKVLVATTGRVKIKVDASAGPIQVGDLLVTSSVPGVAMKSLPIDVGGVEMHRPGTLIGKALEPLTKGQGEILALLSLQ